MHLVGYLYEDFHDARSLEREAFKWGRLEHSASSLRSAQSDFSLYLIRLSSYKDRTVLHHILWRYTQTANFMLYQNKKAYYRL
jgi:hypothetical protein